MPQQYVSASEYDRTLEYLPNATNDDLVRLTVAAARRAWPAIKWPEGVPYAKAARIAYTFARSHVRYIREDGDQLIRMPWRTLADGQGDCKSIAVLVAALCAAAGCRVVLRFVQYAGEDWYAHVFAVVDGVPVDPELQFGESVSYLHHVDRIVR